MRVTLLATTLFYPPSHTSLETGGRLASTTPWRPESGVTSADALAEFAGRACYQSWDRPNPATATNAGYLDHIIEVGHESVLEHASATFYVEDVSRSLTHELVRHRHLSYSQLSQRFVDEDRPDGYVTPPAVAALDGPDGELARSLVDQHDARSRVVYADLVQLLAKGGAQRKQARQAARCVLPNMTETKIVVTGNMRAWRHFIDMRATLAADVEIRELAVEVLRRLREYAPATFADFTIVAASLDGPTYATRRPVEEA